jgi:hypothetical protein
VISTGSVGREQAVRKKNKIIDSFFMIPIYSLTPDDPLSTTQTNAPSPAAAGEGNASLSDNPLFG